MTLGSIPILNIYYLLCYAWRRVQEKDKAQLAKLKGLETVQDLLGKVLASGVDNLFRRGVDRDYLEKQEDLAGIRGKLQVGETAKRMLPARGRAACEFEELSVDILPNRILRTSLLRLLNTRTALNQDVRSEVRFAFRKLKGVSSTRLQRNTFGHVQYSGNRRLYGFLLSVCKLLYESSMVDETTGHTRFRDFRRDKSTMWKIFEEFVTEFYKREQQEYRVNAKGRHIRWADAKHTADQANSDLIPEMTADIILESDERRIILDTKYYRDALASRSGSRGKLHSGNLYQLLTYLRNRQATCPDGAKHEGILLYPEVGESLRAEVWLEGFRIQARTVNLHRAWRQIHKEMLDTIGVSGNRRP